MLNQIPPISEGRQPRALVKINDTVISKIISVEYVENNTYIPDTFRVQLPLYDLDPAIDVEYWMSQPALLVNIFMGFPENPDNFGINDIPSLILGAIDQLNVHIFENGGIVEFSGRDLSSKLIDIKTTDKFPNQTASQIATQFATENGLNPVVTKTTQLVGYYYTQDQVQLGSELTEWDLLVYLAQREGFQVFVRDENLFFKPRQTEDSNPYVLQATTLENGKVATYNGKTLTLARNLTYAKDVIVTVKSWNAKTGHVTATVRASKTSKKAVAAIAKSIGQPQKFQYFIPGLSKEQAIQRARKLLEDITLFEKVLDTDLPGDNLLRKDTIIQLSGVSASADQIYYPDTITRRIAPGAGYDMELRAKNHSPVSVVLA